MMQQLKINMILCLLLFFFSCSNSSLNKDNKQNGSNQHDSERCDYMKTIEFLNKYNTDKSIAIPLSENMERHYNIEDSLLYYLSSLKFDDLYEDNNFRYHLGQFVERNYLSMRKANPKLETEWQIYNVNAWAGFRKSLQFAVNFISDNKFRDEETFQEYSEYPKRDFICIDSIILKLDKNPCFASDSVHKTCMNLVNNNQTGGCYW